MSDQASAVQYVALVRTEFPDGKLNALPGGICKTDHLSRGKIGLLVKMGAIMPKAEFDALPDEEKERRFGIAFEQIFSESEIAINNGGEGE